jgi:hypothetical protein
MPAFLEYSGVLINLDQVREVHGRRKAGAPPIDGTTTFIFADGTKTTIQCDVRRDLQQQGLTIPAAPGFELLQFHFYNAESAEPNIAEVLDIRQHNPIVGWRVEHSYGTITPVTVDEDISSAGGGGYVSAILCPSGQVINPCDQSWSNINEWAKYVLVEWTKWNEKRKTEAA